jgi:hypothetical protein
MKRSDAIDSIVYHCLSWDGLDTCGVPAEEIANDILTHLEKLGMLPPGYCKPIPFESDGKQYPLIPGDFKINGVWCTPGRNEWEPEDNETR